MKSCLLLAFTISVAQAVTHGFRGTPLSYYGRSNVGQQFPQYSSQRIGYSGRPGYSETFHQEIGNFYGGQRDGRFISRDGGNNVRGLQYSVQPGSDFSSSRAQFGGPYNQQYRGQNQIQRQGFGYGRGQINFNAPLANTRSYSPRYDSYGGY